jgi:predicted ATPase/Flp pilus assembly protein TadD
VSVREGLVVDRYVVERSLGKGSTAEVWSVRHRTLGTRRALKVLFLKRSDLRARLHEEGRAHARLSNDHIVPVLDVIDIEGAPALVMPLIEGPSLAQLLEVHRPSEAEVAAIMRALLSGVEAAHAAGLVHRDLKPSNVLLDLTSGGVQPRIADFGVARTAGSDVTHSGAPIGTPVYAAPEQLRGAASADARADFWSLGVMLYELLTGTRPFGADNLVALVRAMEAETFSLPGNARWAELVRDLLRARPEARLCDFEEIRRRIDAISPPSDRSPLGPGTPFATVAWRMRAPEPEGVAVTVGPTETALPRRDNLPRQRDAFVGRIAEASALRAHLERSRLVTVTGPGGVGKTRLVLHVARTLLGEFPRVVFCDLTEARSVDGILYAVAKGLDLALGADPIKQLGHAIAGRGRLLVVMDNFEQVVEHAAATVGAWIDRAPDAVFLVTSREPLRLPGESVYPLDVLSLPHEKAPVTIDGSDAVGLFVTRAQQSEPSFRVAEDNADTIAQLVRRLDGLPLAIELAAARVSSSTPARLLERLSKRFDLLAGTARDVPSRQQSLRATLDWSWDQLAPTLQDAFAQLSVFEGGWTLEAAESVLRLDDEASAVEDVLAELVDRGLVRIEVSPATGRPRFGMLVSVHEYAAEKRHGLQGSAEVEERHGAWFARFGSHEAIESLFVHRGVARRLGLGQELENLVAACGRAVTRNEGAFAVAVLEAAWAVLQFRGPFAVGVSLAERVLGLSSLSAREQASTGFVLGVALHHAGRVDEGRAHLDVALAVAREVGNRRVEGFAVGRLGILHHDQGRLDEGRAHLEAALVVAREVGDRRLEAIVFNSLGILYMEQGRMDETRVHYDAALAVVREVGDRRTEGIVLSNLGILHMEQGRMDEARAHYGAALAVAREVGDRRHESGVLGNLGYLDIDRGWMDEARAHYDAALAVALEVGDRRSEGVMLVNLGELHYEQGRMDEARAHLDAALAVAREVGNRRVEGFAVGRLGNLLRFLGEHGTAIQHLADALALHREVGFRYGQPYWLGALALIEADAERGDAALALAHEAVAIAAPFPVVQLKSLETLARVHLARGEVPAARDAIARARSLAQPRIALLAAVDALVAVAQGDRAAAELAVAEATANPALCMPGTEVAQLVAQARRGLESLDVAIAREEPSGP